LELRDRVARGFLAGVSGGVLMNILSYVSYLLGVANLRYIDWPAIIITGHTPNNALETVFALLVQLIFVGFLGIVFTYLISTLIESSNHLFKGVLFGFISWFAIYAFTFLADVIKLTPLDMGTALTDFAGAVVFGLTLAQVLFQLDNRQGLE